VLLTLGGVYAAVDAFIGVHSGGDLAFHLRLSERLLHGQPLYADFDGSIGLPWPPFAIVALTPFALLARISLPLAKCVWAIGNVALFGGGFGPPAERSAQAREHDRREGYV